MTVGELKKALEDIPDWFCVAVQRFTSGDSFGLTSGGSAFACQLVWGKDGLVDLNDKSLAEYRGDIDFWFVISPGDRSTPQKRPDGSRLLHEDKN